MTSNYDQGEEGGGLGEEGLEQGIGGLTQNAEGLLDQGGEGQQQQQPMEMAGQTGRQLLPGGGSQQGGTGGGGGKRARSALKSIKENVERGSKDISGLAKMQQTAFNRLEREISTLKNNLTALRKTTAETERTLRKQETQLNRILKKVGKSSTAKVSRSKTGRRRRRS